ncbi:hypothetical protein [Pontibacter litorisediminis]|uniref:hypothetical protein n=1 Tax=Pontibacter litorisediminis TaxID=1846260 RepID=UPI0023EC5C79|nr:hypothetical protein [Pontibacter litorisediminis]
MKRHILLLALPLAILGACQSGASGEEEKTELETKVMAIHDEAMARMGDIYKLRRTLRSMRDTLEAQQQTDSTTVLALEQEISGLNKADEAMMQWMRQYSAPDTLQHEQAMDYLQQELVKVERVQTIMDSTIEAAQTTVKKYEQEK